jgi:hypothetical protein
MSLESYRLIFAVFIAVTSDIACTICLTLNIYSIDEATMKCPSALLLNEGLKITVVNITDRWVIRDAS